MINLNNLLASIAGSIGIVTIASYILKHIFERVLDSKLKKFEEKIKANIQEESRRAAIVFDQQFDAYKTIVGLIYRSRNTARSIIDLYKQSNYDEMERGIIILMDYHRAMANILYDERTVMHDEFFGLVHDTKKRIQDFATATDRLRGRVHLKGKFWAGNPKDLEVYYADIDAMLNKTIKMARKTTGIMQKESK